MIPYISIQDRSLILFAAHISIDHGELKDLIQREIGRIKNKLVEFAAYMKEIKVPNLSNYVRVSVD